jgi:hypothetical protein
MTTWQLYVDETGNFGGVGPVAIAGVLLEGRAAPQLAQALRAKLEAIFDGVPYPPHAAFHKQPLSLLWGPVHDRGSSSRFRVATMAAKAALDQTTQGPLEALRRAIMASARPDAVSLALYREAGSELRRLDWHAHERLELEVKRARQELACFLARDLPQLAERAGGRGVALVAAWQDGEAETEAERRGDRVTLARRADARYVAVYEALLERCLSLVGAPSRQTEIWAHLADRGWAEPRPAVAAALNGAEARALAFPLVRQSSPRVIRVTASRYDPSVAPGIVLADFAANALLPSLRERHAWIDVQHSMEERTGLRPRATCALLGGLALPAVAADGRPRAAIRAHAEPTVTSAPVTPLSGVPRWASEQAGAWVSAVREHWPLEQGGLGA